MLLTKQRYENLEIWKISIEIAKELLKFPAAIQK
jgi:hypothetical protein